MKKLTLLLMTVVFALSALAQAPAATGAKASTAKMAAAKAAAPSDKDIADAKAKGLVWVNTGSKTKAYHKSDSSYYGKTKEGKFMTEADAQKAGYHAAGTKSPAKAATGKK